MTQDLLADEDLDEEIRQLDEIALRTVAIGGFLMKTKQYANKIDTEVRRLVADADKLKRTDTLDFRQFQDFEWSHFRN